MVFTALAGGKSERGCTPTVIVAPRCYSNTASAIVDILRLALGSGLGLIAIWRLV
jgi:hypothetical protein